MERKEPILIEPVFKEMIWGGTRLRDEYGYDIPGPTTGECWGISAHPGGDCRIRSGIYEGKTLSWLWKEHRELFGNAEGDRFPLLVKIIDARENLSIQVHPDDAYAAVHEDGALGKTECWYILDCPPDGEIVIGHNAKSREEAKQMIEEERWEDFIRRIPIHKGDFFQINPGCVHAICKGTLLLETQQNSDITYRVYDYGRRSGGKPRQLHIRQSLDVIEIPFRQAEARPVVTGGDGWVKEELYRCRYYTVGRLRVSGRASFSQEQPFLNVSVVGGRGRLDGQEIKKGDHLILPAGWGEFTVEGDLEMMTSHL